MKVDLILKVSDGTHHLKQVDLSRIPVIGEKVNVIIDDSFENVYRVIDVLFYENQCTDVFVVLNGSIASCIRNAGSSKAEL